MKMNHLVQLPPEDQMRLTATMQQTEVCTNGAPLYDFDPDGFEEFLCVALDIFDRADIITPDELEELDIGVAVTGTTIINILLSAAECEASQGYNVLVALPQGPRWFQDYDRAGAIGDVEDVVAPRHDLPCGARWPTEEEAIHITKLWHARLSIDEDARDDTDDINRAVSIVSASIYAIHSAMNTDDYDLIRGPDGEYPATPLAMLNMVLHTVCPGAIVGCFDGVLSWVILEQLWPQCERLRSFNIPRDYFDLTPFYEGWFEGEDDYVDDYGYPPDASREGPWPGGDF